MPAARRSTALRTPNEPLLPFYKGDLTMTFRISNG
jgi:hypothetical protein